MDAMDQTMSEFVNEMNRKMNGTRHSVYSIAKLQRQRDLNSSDNLTSVYRVKSADLSQQTIPDKAFYAPTI